LELNSGLELRSLPHLSSQSLNLFRIGWQKVLAPLDNAMARSEKIKLVFGNSEVLERPTINVRHTTIDFFSPIVMKSRDAFLCFKKSRNFLSQPCSHLFVIGFLGMENYSAGLEDSKLSMKENASLMAQVLKYPILVVIHTRF
jgi:hypothetical protein